MLPSRVVPYGFNLCRLPARSLAVLCGPRHSRVDIHRFHFPEALSRFYGQRTFPFSFLLPATVLPLERVAGYPDPGFPASVPAQPGSILKLCSSMFQYPSRQRLAYCSVVLLVDLLWIGRMKKCCCSGPCGVRHCFFYRSSFRRCHKPFHGPADSPDLFNSLTCECFTLHPIENEIQLVCELTCFIHR